MRDIELGGLRVRITGGPDREGGGDGPVVVLLHGFGAPGTDLVGLWRVLDVPRETRFVFPEAPMALPPAYGAGRAWWMIDVDAMERAIATGAARDRRHEDPEDMHRAREAVERMLDAVQEELHVTGDQLVLGGFSQGAMVSCDVAFRTDRPLAGLVLMSGTLLAEDAWRKGMPTRAGLPVLVSHGERDPILPFDLSVALKDALTEAGLSVTWVPHRGAHEIPGPVTDALGAMLSR